MSTLSSLTEVIEKFSDFLEFGSDDNDI